ncbi:MAG TPA: YoaK family protein [Trebonia sp.]|nr:YoaK family protein [Trebonia sp.]
MAAWKASQKHAIRVRDGLVVVLALTTGAVDAVTFVRLGHVFSSVITGNLALLGIAAGQREGSLAVNGGLALAGYGLGVLVGRAVAGESPDAQRIWPRRSTMALIAELLALAGFSAGWLVTSGHPAGGTRMTLVVVASAAMGMQSTAVRRLGQMSSTYLTSTLTGIIEAFALRRWPQDWQRSAGVLLTLVTGAVLGAGAATVNESLLPLVLLIPVAFVVICSAWSVSLRQPRKPEGEHDGQEPGARERH